MSADWTSTWTTIGPIALSILGGLAYIGRKIVDGTESLNTERREQVVQWNEERRQHTEQYVRLLEDEAKRSTENILAQRTLIEGVSGLRQEMKIMRECLQSVVAKVEQERIEVISAIKEVMGR